MDFDENTKHTQKIPGPKAFPLLGWRGNLLRFYPNPFLYLNELHKTYGNIVGIAQNNTSIVFAFGSEMNEIILKNLPLFETSPGAFTKVPKDTSLGKIIFHNLQIMRGDKHKQHRRLMQPAFHRQQITHYNQDMIQLTQQLLDQWETQTQINLLPEMKKLTQKIAVKTLFGLRNDSELDYMGSLLQKFTKSTLLVTIAPINFPGTPYYRALRIAEQLEGSLQSMIAQKRSEKNATDILASLIHVHDEDGEKLSDTELIGHMFTLFVAGHETTSNALTWTLFLLSQHPSILQTLQDELESILQGNPPTIEQLPQLTFLDCVIKESLRLLPPASIGIRVTTAPCNLGGFAIPEDSHVIFSQFVTHRNPDLYKNPNQFNPERWLSIHPTPYEYLPFSAGPHMCIGAGFAMQELKVVLSMILQRYQLSVVPNAKIDPNLSMSPIHGMPMQILSKDQPCQRVPIRGSIQQMIDFHSPHRG